MNTTLTEYDNNLEGHVLFFDVVMVVVTVVFEHAYHQCLLKKKLSLGISSKYTGVHTYTYIPAKNK